MDDLNFAGNHGKGRNDIVNGQFYFKNTLQLKSRSWRVSIIFSSDWNVSSYFIDLPKLCSLKGGDSNFKLMGSVVLLSMYMIFNKYGIFIKLLLLLDMQNTVVD